MSEEISLKDTLKNIASKLDELTEQKKVQKFNLLGDWWMFWKKPTKGEIKRNWVSIVYIQENKNVVTMKVPIDEGVILINGIPHTVNASEVLMYKGKPLLIVPSWSIKPFSPEQNIKETKESGNTTLGWEYLINYIKKTELKQLKSMGVMIWIVVILVLIGAGYYAIKSGWLG